MKIEQLIAEFDGTISTQTLVDLRHAAGAIWAVEANRRLKKWPHLEEEVFLGLTPKDVSMFPNGTPGIPDGAGSPDKNREGGSWPRFIKRVFAETWKVWNEEVGPTPLSVPKIEVQDNNVENNKHPLTGFSPPAKLAYYLCVDVDPGITPQDCWWVAFSLRKEAREVPE